MTAEVDPSVAEALRGLIDVVSGARHLLLGMAARLPVKAEDDETPETGAMLLGSRLRCIVRDQLDSALESLRSLTDEAASEPPFSETVE
jgi:hypothetical protein